YVSQLAGAPGKGRVRAVIAPSAPHRCSADFLFRCRELAENTGAPLMTHLLETRMQVVTAEKLFGKSMVAYLDDLGFLTPRTTLIHGVWLTDDDRRRIARSGATVQYNPWSNAILGAGTADFRVLREAGINVS